MADAFQAMVDGINNGAYLVNFVGHGGPRVRRRDVEG